MRILHGCCDNIHILHRPSKFWRCNDGITQLPVWKRLVQILLGYHRHNVDWRNPLPHEATGWKLKILKYLIKPVEGDSIWRWVKTSQTICNKNK